MKVVLVCLIVWAGVARADTSSGSGISTPTVLAYIVPAIAAGLGAGVNGALLAFDEAAPSGWRLFGYVSGGIELAVGVTIFAVGHSTSEGIVLGTIASSLGVAAILTAIFVKHPDDTVGPVAVPWIAPGGGGVAVSLRF